MTENLSSLIDAYCDDYFAEAPVLGTTAGLDGYDHLLGDYSASAFANRAAKTDDWYSRFSAIPDAGLTTDDIVDRDVVISALRGSQIMRDWMSWKKDPSTYLGPALQGVFSLFLHRLRPESELADAAAQRLKQVPQLIEEGKANLDPELASPLIVERALAMCQAGTTYFRQLVPAEVSSDDDKRKLADAGEPAAKAFEEFSAVLSDLKDKASGDWMIGPARYSALLLEKEKLGYGIEEMLDKGRAVYAELDEQMADFTESWKGTRDWASVCVELDHDHPETPDQMRAEYEEWTERARQFLKDKDLVSFPEGEQCHVVPSPHFQRPILAVASYNAPPAFKPGVKGFFFVPYPPEGTSDEDVQKRLATNSRMDIPTTAIHEAYPGHHWHFIKIKQNPRKIRKVHWTSYFVEGWALYTEKMMFEQGVYDSPAHELGYMKARIFRAARIIVDTSLHSGKMDFEEAVGFMVEKAGLTEPTARAEVGRYCSWPTQAPSYLTGSLEIERMQSKWLAEGRELKAFHDKIATSGALPIGLAERALFA